jgi:hypothetical protein
MNNQQTPYRFTPNEGVDSDQIIVSDGKRVLGSFLAHRGWAWWPVTTLDGRCVAHVRKDREAAAHALIDCTNG